MVSTSEGVWRSGHILVMRRGAQLPDRCIKTNQSANGKRFKATLYWHHPAIYLLMLFNLLIYAIVAIAVRKKAIINLGVTEGILRKRRRVILGSWIVGLTGVILLFVELSVQSYQFVVLALFLILGGLSWGIAGSTLVKVERMEDDYVWIGGVSKDYLALLPEWNPEWNK